MDDVEPRVRVMVDSDSEHVPVRRRGPSGMHGKWRLYFLTACVSGIGHRTASDAGLAAMPFPDCSNGKMYLVGITAMRWLIENTNPHDQDHDAVLRSFAGPWPDCFGYIKYEQKMAAR